MLGEIQDSQTGLLRCVAWDWGLITHATRHVDDQHYVAVDMLESWPARLVRRPYLDEKTIARVEGVNLNAGRGRLRKASVVLAVILEG